MGLSAMKRRGTQTTGKQAVESGESCSGRGEDVVAGVASPRRQDVAGPCGGSDLVRPMAGSIAVRRRRSRLTVMPRF
jgi:hypothetical protein